MSAPQIPRTEPLFKYFLVPRLELGLTPLTLVWMEQTMAGYGTART